MNEPLRALLIRRPWIDMILDGRKTWEMRGARTSVRGRIARCLLTKFRAAALRNTFRSGSIGSPGATRKTMQVVNSDADLLSRHVAQMASRFHHTTKILLTASPVWTQMTTAVDRAAVGHVVASTHGLLRHRIYPIGLLNVGFVDFPYLG